MIGSIRNKPKNPTTYPKINRITEVFIFDYLNVSSIVPKPV